MLWDDSNIRVQYKYISTLKYCASCVTSETCEICKFACGRLLFKGGTDLDEILIVYKLISFQL